jgi:hypothetical protein
MTAATYGKAPPPLTPPHKGEGDVDVGAHRLMWLLSSGASPSNSPSPLWGGVRGGGSARAIAVEKPA